MNQDKKEAIRAGIEKAIGGLPYVFRQSELRRKLDGISPGGLGNLDAAGKGPGCLILVGRKAAYPADAYVEWLVGRITEASK